MACISACAVTSLSISVRLCVRAMMRPLHTTIAPMGISSSSKAFCASASAMFMYSLSVISLTSHIVLAEQRGVVFVEVFVNKRQKRLTHPITLIAYSILLQVFVDNPHLFVADEAYDTRVSYGLCACCRRFRCFAFLGTHVILIRVFSKIKQK